MIRKQYYLITLLLISSPLMGMQPAAGAGAGHPTNPSMQQINPKPATASIGTQTTPQNQQNTQSTWDSVKNSAVNNAWEFGGCLKNVAMTALAGYVFGKVFPQGGNPTQPPVQNPGNLALPASKDLPDLFKSK